MNLVLNQSDYSINNVYFSEPIKNSIIERGMFIRILYSNHLMTLNGIYMNIEISKPNSFSNEETIQAIQTIKQIEIDILNKANIEHKKKIFKIQEQLKNGYIKYLFESKQNNKFILKISGIWENENEYGLTFKLLDMNHL